MGQLILGTPANLLIKCHVADIAAVGTFLNVANITQFGPDANLTSH